MAYSNKALPAGTILREWRLEQVLGVGGFGIVYKGRGIYFDELVAIKEYFPSAISDRVDGDTVVPTHSDAEEVHALGLKKFVEEAKLLWNLSKPTRHPNIVSVRSLFEIHGTAYMVMDFEDGRSLSEILKEGRRFTEESLMALIRPISEGLDRAHRVGVLHRDIKPPNILVGDDGHPVLIDFGSARFDSGQATSTTVTFHTPPYAAIEQYVKTYEQGPWTDVYALAVVLYECVTGTKPPEVLERLHGGDMVALADGDWPGYSRAFLRAVDIGMTIRPDDRPQSIPQWLALFDLDDDVPAPQVGIDSDDAPTRFAAFQELPAEILPVKPPLPVEVQATLVAPEPAVGEEPPAVPKAAPAPETPPSPKAATQPAADKPAPSLPPSGEKAPARRKAPVLAALAVVVGGTVLGASYVLTRPGGAQGVASAGDSIFALADSSTDAAAADEIPSSPNATAGLMHALAAQARRSGASQAALKAFDDAVAKADALAAAPEAAQPGSAVSGQIDALAKQAGGALSNALMADVSAHARRLGGRYPWIGSGGATPAQKAAVRSLRAAQQRLGDAAARSAAGPGVAETLAATRDALNANQAFAAAAAQIARAADNQAVDASSPALIETPTAVPEAAPSPSATAPGNPSRAMQSTYAQVDAVVASARPIAERVISMGNGPKPGSGASSDERKGYATRQSNARRAEEYMNHLTLLSRTVRSAPSEAAASGYVKQARMVKGYLDTLLSSSQASLR